MQSEYKMRTVRQDRQLTRDDVSRLEIGNPKLKPLNDATINQPRGFSITKHELLAIIDEPDERTQKKIIKQWKACIFWARGITVDYSAKIRGYVFPCADSELRGGHDKRLAAQERRLKKEALRLAVIRDDDLTDHDKRRRMLLANQVNAAASKINSSRSMAMIWNRQPETLPRIEV